jgi:nucleoside-diphosphate-sugar epimerase
MQILIVGGAGEVGRYLLKDFSQKGYEVTILDRAPKVPEVDEKRPLTYLQGNLTDAALVNKAVDGKHVIINLAWSFADDPSSVKTSKAILIFWKLPPPLKYAVLFTRVQQPFMAGRLYIR